MKQIKIKQYTGILYIAKLLVLLVTGIGMISCIDDLQTTTPVNPGNEETDVRLTITAPGASSARSATRSAIDTEYLISTVKLLVFKQEGTQFNFWYMVDGQQLTPDQNNQQRTSFIAKLKASDEPFKIIFVANANEIFSGYTPAFGATEEQVREKINTPFHTNYNTGIPMYGETIRPSLDAKEINTINLIMLRAIARIDVKVDLNMDKSLPFRMQEVYIYRANNLVQVIPAPEALNSNQVPKVSQPTVPVTVIPLPNPYRKEVGYPGSTTIDRMYVPEALSTSDPGEQQLEATCVIVGGYFNEEETESFYRIDFNPGEAAHPFGQILRNYRYEFNIKQVTGTGWETPDEAARNRATTIVAEVRYWEDFTMEMFVNGDNYFGIDSRDIIFGYQSGLQKTAGVESTVPYQIRWEGSGQTTGIDGEAIINDYFTARIESRPEEGETISRIVFTTRTENNTQQKRTSKLIVEWANWIFEVNVTQLYEEAHVERSIRILSIYKGTAGNLGLIDAPASVMGGILMEPENFSPRGTVNHFSGFDFSVANTQSIFRKANGTNDETYKMLTLLYGCDVLYLGNDNYISEYAAQKVMEWHQESPRRVLMVGGDSPSTSYGLIREDRNGPLFKYVDWYYNVAHEGNYKVEYLGGSPKFVTPATINEDNREFMDGPFGQITTSLSIDVTDGYYGYAKKYADHIVPIFVVDKNPNYMAVGIDKQNRIIYHGDASLFQVGRMPNMGKVINENEKLWANIWAWIADQVLWGDNPIPAR